MRTLLRSLTVVSFLLVAGCGAVGAGDDAGSDGAMPAVVQEGVGGEMGDDAAYEEGAADSAASGEVGGVVRAAEDRQFITEGSVTVTVESPRRAAAAVAQMVERLGGHVQERVEQGTDEDESAYLVVRIPATEVTGALEQLASLGTVEDTSVNSTEVTAQARDLDARIRALEISVERLEDLLSRADSTEAVVAAEQALTERQSELESMVSQRNRLADQVALSTLRVDLWTEDTVPPEPPAGFWGGLQTGWNSLVATASGVLLALGVLLPWLLVIGLVALAVLAVRRRRRPTDRSGPAATAPSGPAPTAAPASPATARPAQAPPATSPGAETTAPSKEP